MSRATLQMMLIILKFLNHKIVFAGLIFYVRNLPQFLYYLDKLFALQHSLTKF